MKPRRSVFNFGLCAVFAIFCMGLVPPATCGPLRINLTNGTSLEVPYYWEENGEIKFEMPGGVAGIPKADVKSVQEIVAMREFDPEVLVESKNVHAEDDRGKALLELAEKQAPALPAAQKVSPEESLALLDRLASKSSSAAAEHVYGPVFSQQGDFTELVRMRGNELMLVMQNILTSRDELSGRKFSLTLYDSEGNVLQRQSCELLEVEADPKTMKNLGLKGHLYSVVATIKPDPRISRYEISALR